MPPPTATTIATAGIPRFISNLSGREYSLRDVIDFRPYVTATATVEGTFEDADASVNPSNTEAITGTQYVSTPNESWIGDIQFYLPRKDRLVVDEGTLRVVHNNGPGNLGRTPKVLSRLFGDVVLKRK